VPTTTTEDTSTSLPQISVDRYHSLRRRVEARLPDAETAFNNHSKRYGVIAALDVKLSDVRQAQGYDEYTETIRQAVSDQISEAENGLYYNIHLQNFENAVEAQRQKIEDDSIRNHTLSDLEDEEEAYKKGRLHALNAVMFCEELIEELK